MKVYELRKALENYAPGAEVLCSWDCWKSSMERFISGTSSDGEEVWLHCAAPGEEKETNP